MTPPKSRRGAGWLGRLVRHSDLPALPREVKMNEYINVVPHDASEHNINANANLVILWAEAIASRGFDPQGVVMVTPNGRYKIFKQSDRWQVSSHA